MNEYTIGTRRCFKIRIEQKFYFSASQLSCLKATNAPKKDYVVIFTGSGCTGALHKAIQSLSCSWKNPYLVFVGPFEHHSNILPWREQEGVELIQIGQTKCGQFNYDELEQYLKQSENDPRPKVGAFSKASNVTG